VSTELKGRVRERVWTRPTCLDDGEPLPLGRLARRDFKRHCREEGPGHVMSPDMIGEAFEMLDPAVG
jgi:hypothetical protein